MIPFKDSSNINIENNSDTILKHHKEFISKFEKLKIFQLESDISNGKYIWKYSLTKDNMEVYIEVSNRQYWNISIDLEYSKNGIIYDNSYESNYLTYENFILQFKKYIELCSI